MAKNNTKKQHQVPPRIFYGNPYDVETFLEGISIASHHNKELLFVDRFVTYLRLDPERDVTDVVFNILRDFDIIKFESV